MSSEVPVRVVLFQVREPHAKLARLVETASAHFEKRESFLIAAEDEKAVQFIDELLWKFAPTSFLPHQASDEETSSIIAITRCKKNINRARFVFNLSPTPLLINGGFRVIYDFEDLTSPSKQQLSMHRFDAYKKGGFLIEAR